ncbi:hypothetical protein PHLGIDRAFT_130532 [Phlebiopsis gigantea 11061_1 CR5-6]|uniref:Fe2OG dioxygenase domain-containing protein n=1 Tax=Phlebiopsis gigantea (strain 11061_1 CR5-6) TaxID=745531 RepID=A0A0C3S123_PHLG1|nr:hypothetical protein PHLGIDRAFT_130532 [Phlebiopsis gigantea 11061_1 CR5-6]
MTVTTIPTIPHYEPAAPSQEDLDYANLAIIDLSKYSTPEGRAELVDELRDAVRTYGFFYVINHGMTNEQTRRIFDIADVPFSQVSDEEKQKYAGKMREVGTYQGYKLRKYWHINGGVRDQIENYNINKQVHNKEHPVAVRPLMSEIETFTKHNHFNVLHPILRLLATSLELPEDTLTTIHGYEAPGDTWLRFMKYYPRSEEEEAQSGNIWLKGHTDFGSITLLWSQPVSALQIMTPEGKWKWVRHIENALVVNSGDSLEFLSGGFYKPTIHRVVQPPSDQRGYPRLGAFYFAVPDDNVRLVPLMQSPVIQREGIKRRFTDEDAPTVEEYRKGRVAAYGQSQLKKSEEKGVEVEYIGKVLVKHYN